MQGNSCSTFIFILCSFSDVDVKRTHVHAQAEPTAWINGEHENADPSSKWVLDWQTFGFKASHQQTKLLLPQNLSKGVMNAKLMVFLLNSREKTFKHLPTRVTLTGSDFLTPLFWNHTRCISGAQPLPRAWRSSVSQLMSAQTAQSRLRGWFTLTHCCASLDTLRLVKNVNSSFHFFLEKKVSLKVVFFFFLVSVRRNKRPPVRNGWEVAGFTEVSRFMLLDAQL